MHVFTSPHLVRFNERIRIAGKLIGDEPLSALLTEVLDVSDGIEPSFFEVAATVAILAFSRTPADACILEVGLGGRLDATNVIERPLVCGIADLALDHQQFLGTGLAGIAAEKAAIAKPGVPLVTQLYRPEIAASVGEVAHGLGAPWLPRGGLWDATVRHANIRYGDERGEFDLSLPRLLGSYQAMNAALAIAMLRHQDRLEVPETALEEAMGLAVWPARMQRLAPGPLVGDREVWLDGGHNPSAALLVADFAKRDWTDGKPLHIVFASLAPKNPSGMLQPFADVAAHVHAVPIPDHSCFDPDELVRIGGDIGLSADSHVDVASALADVPKDARVLIFGSLYLAGAVLAANGEVPD